ncbi:MAG: hypothetical protein OET90_06665 [Desulfuromonadales bacterium]|nr:hypothetical protein [Desulfuromonadales bacterium]
MLRRTVKMLLISLATFALSTTSSVADTAALQKRLDQQERRIERLERAVENLQYQLGEVESSGAAAQRGLEDPLVGTWECTNKVFVYDMTFFADGHLLQETPTFGKVKDSQWQRVADNEILLQGGIRLITSFSSEQYMTVTNKRSPEQSAWECQKTTP